MRRVFQLLLIVALAGLLVAAGTRPFPALPHHLRHSLSRVNSGSSAPSFADAPDLRVSSVALWGFTLGLICFFPPSRRRWHRPRVEDFSQFVRPPPSY
ncbi:MAG: hypothetical protein LAN83_10420 [Acidobacteriia bacterium]|nr:hypothetical protein [Terriglobia bacterium]